jgi:beta-aspartyl-dipeptidase (metallo-type)
LITVIKNINVYAPEKLGKKDVVIVSDKIEGIYDNVNIPNDWKLVDVLSTIAYYISALKK